MVRCHIAEEYHWSDTGQGEMGDVDNDRWLIFVVCRRRRMSRFNFVTIIY